MLWQTSHFSASSWKLVDFFFWQVMRRSGRLHGTVSFEIHLQESPSLLKVHDMIPTRLPSKEFSPETQPQSQPQGQGLGSYQHASWKASAKTAGQENQHSSAPTAASNYPVPRNRVYAFQPPNPKTESKSLLSSFSWLRWNQDVYAD